EARSIANLLGHDVDLRAQEGDADGALVSCRAFLNAGRAIGDEPQFQSQLLRTILQQEAVVKMERTLAQGEPTETVLQALQALLADEDRHPVMLIALRGERAWADLLVQNLQQGTIRGIFFGVPRGAAAVGPLPSDIELGMIASGSLKGQRAALLSRYTDFVEAAKLPPEQMYAQLRQLMTSLAGSNPPAVIREFPIAALVQRVQTQH